MRPAIRVWGVFLSALALAACGERAASPVRSPKEGDAMTTPATTDRRALLPLDGAAPSKLETATFALGWFWGPDSQFGGLAGVVRTRVGYAGGTKKSPTYHDLGDHSESIQIDYDPARISYADLLDVFWNTHNPCGKGWSRQYMSGIWVGNEEQKRVALSSKAREEKRRGAAIATEISPLREFTLAEDYHQKYELRSDAQLMKEFRDVYSDAQFVDSTVAMRVNAAIGGHLKGDLLRSEIDRYGLSASARERLLRAVK